MNGWATSQRNLRRLLARKGYLKVTSGLGPLRTALTGDSTPAWLACRMWPTHLPSYSIS